MVYSWCPGSVSEHSKLWTHTLSGHTRLIIPWVLWSAIWFHTVSAKYNWRKSTTFMSSSNTSRLKNVCFCSSHSQFLFRSLMQGTGIMSCSLHPLPKPTSSSKSSSDSLCCTTLAGGYHLCQQIQFAPNSEQKQHNFDLKWPAIFKELTNLTSLQNFFNNLFAKLTQKLWFSHFNAKFRSCPPFKKNNII